MIKRGMKLVLITIGGIVISLSITTIFKLNSIIRRLKKKYGNKVSEFRILVEAIMETLMDDKISEVEKEKLKRAIEEIFKKNNNLLREDREWLMEKNLLKDN